MKLYFQNTKTEKTFEVVKLEDTKIYLKGEHGEFDMDYDKERFIKLGYTLIKQEEPDKENPNP